MTVLEIQDLDHVALLRLPPVGNPGYTINELAQGPRQALYNISTKKKPITESIAP